MNVAPDQTIILGRQIFLDHQSLSSIGQKILMILHPPFPTHPFFDVGDDFDVIMMTFVWAPGMFRWTMMSVLAALFLALVHVITVRPVSLVHWLSSP